MVESAPTSNASSHDSRTYRRSWKNLLINKRYQLRFTLFMVGLSAALMVLLGIWVKRVADNTTEVGLARVRGEACPPLPQVPGAALGAQAPAAAAPAAAAVQPSAPVTSTDGSGDEPSEPSEPSVPSEPSEPSVPSEIVEPGAAAAEAEPARARVSIDESSMTLTTMVPADLSDRVVSHWECEIRQAGLISDLEQRRRNIVWVLLGSGLLLCAGLAVYGIKMTHRVAGPLHKVGLYFVRMRDGHYGSVYPLRKGDELMEFYEHFKAAHAGVVTAETSDLTRLRAVVGAMGQAPQDPALQQAAAELQAVIERKEKALE